nr:c-type cytochrome [Rufibacter latericius]
MQVAEGFEVVLVAAEPLVSSPVALSFDEQGRMWVVEMTGYMPDTTGAGEDLPTGKIVILEDTNQDGVADTRKVFLDSLRMPRAICLVGDGILVAEPPSLWYYEIKQGKPGKRTLVDAAYAEGGNVEHQPNGLLRALDNWIYSAKSDKRYRKVGDTWVKQQTHFRGQWGISQDDAGRLFYNTNSENLLGDYFMPGFGAANQNQKAVAGFNEKIVANNSVYPIRPTTGVNRGYLEGVLDDSLRLVSFTAASSPLVYRGALFGKEHTGDVFVAEPAANLIKRNTLQTNGYLTTGKQAYKGKEFLASVDERFRPVSLYNAPDGSLVVVDMYRGIIQHKTYLTPYLKKEIAKRNLTQPLLSGRIYKIVPKNSKVRKMTMPKDAVKLVKLLGHENGWIRDKAQQLLIDQEARRIIPELRQALVKSRNPLLVTHALWTLEGLNALRAEEVAFLLRHHDPLIRVQGLSALPSILSGATYQQFMPVFQEMVNKPDTLVAPYLAFLANHLRPFDQEGANSLLKQVVRKHPTNRYVADAVISSLSGREESFQKAMLSFVPDTATALHRQLQQVFAYKKEAQDNRNKEAVLKQFPRGAAMYATSCQTCHGPDGNGVKSLAPPLNHSEWVTGNKSRLAAIVLYGLTGPVNVNGHVYKAPEINGDMPGIGYSQNLPEEDVAELLSYIRKSWKNKASTVHPEEVKKVKQKFKNRQKAFTAEELNYLF